MRRLLIPGILAAVIGVVVALVLLNRDSDSGEPAVQAVPATPTATATIEPTPTPTETPEPTPTPVLTEAERYRAAIEARDAGDLEAAAAGLTTIAGAGSPLAPFASFRLAQVHANAGSHEAAVDAFAAALEDPTLPASMRPIGGREAAASLIALDRLEEAVVQLTAVINDPDAADSEQHAARWARAELLNELGDPLWADDALALIRQAPGHPYASVALDALELAEIEVPALTAAYTRYLARQNTLATERYQAILDIEPNPSTAAVAWFYLGALAERVPDRPAAIAAYTESLAIDPIGSRADDAAYWRGRVAAEEEDFEAAVEYYDFLIAEYPGSFFAADGALRAALAVLETGDEAAALERLAAIATAGGTEASAAAHWYERIAGTEALAAAGIPAATEIDPRAFAAIVTGAEAEGFEQPIYEPLPSIEHDEQAIEDWLIARYGVSTGTSLLDEDQRVALADLLADAGERSLARAVMIEHLDVVASDPHAMISIGQRAAALGLPDVALIASIRLLSPLPTSERIATPPALERLAYPAPWSDLVAAASEEFEVPPLLLLALVRQESAFEPDVISAAGAIGLTQVIPPTGIQIAGALDESWDGPVSLTKPETSLRYGAAYLGTQLETFDGNLFAALAAYNAGPTNAQRWLDSQVQPGADGFVQTIDFEETRRYVTSVVEQYAWYRYVYGLAEQPAIH